MMDLAALLEEAKAYKPRAKSRGKWAQLWPVYQALRENGASCVEAVHWLRERGHVEMKDFNKALNAFHVLATRKKKRP